MPIVEESQEAATAPRDSASSFLVSADEINDMIGGQSKLFEHAGMTADFHIVDEGEPDSRTKKVDCLYSRDGKPYQCSYIIRMPSKLGVWLAGFRGREPQAHVSYDFRQVSVDHAFDFTHAAFDETLDREIAEVA